MANQTEFEEELARFARRCRLWGALFLIVGVPLVIFDWTTGGLRFG